MARTDARFRTAFNLLLEVCGRLETDESLPSELALASELGVSRTVVRAALQAMDDRHIIRWQGRDKTLMRKPTPRDRMAVKDDYVSLAELETSFLEWVLRFDVPADTPLNVTQLAKQFSVPPHSLQEFLAGLSHFGLVERRPRGGWALLGFTSDYALELSEFRTVLELNAVSHLVRLPDDHPVWPALDDLEARHLALLGRIDTAFHDFSRLDESFHAAINSAVNNRFVAEFQKVISLIFHYHYQWDKTNERQRNEAAIGEHLHIIAALRSRDPAAAAQAALSHLHTSKETLQSSLRGHNLV